MIRLARWSTYNKMYVTGRRNVIEKRKDGVSACFSLITPILYLSTFFENSTFSSVTTIGLIHFVHLPPHFPPSRSTLISNTQWLDRHCTCFFGNKRKRFSRQMLDINRSSDKSAPYLNAWRMRTAAVFFFLPDSQTTSADIAFA